MPIPEGFLGPALVRSPDIYHDISDIIGCEVTVIQAVVAVEAAGTGFWYEDATRQRGRPKILFERHKFSQFTRGAFDKTDPGISNPKRGGYLGGIAEYGRLWQAMQRDRTAALMSASWGLHQGMGFNYEVMGYDSVEHYVENMCISEDLHLHAFADFIVGNHLDDELRDKRWLDLAKGYNGTGNAPEYARRLVSAFADAVGKLNTGEDTGIKQYQALLNLLGYGNLVTDGFMGPRTSDAVRRFQLDHGIITTGLLDKVTKTALYSTAPTPPELPAFRSEEE